MDKHWDADQFDHYLEHNLPSPTDLAELIVFTDASSDSFATGAGWVILSRGGGKVCEGRAWSTELGTSSTAGELWAIRRAIQQMEQMDWLGENRVNVYTDCNSLKDVVAGRSSLSGTPDQEYVSSRVTEDQIVCISRNVNQYADSLSRDALFEALRETKLRTEQIQYRDARGRFVSETVTLTDVWTDPNTPHLYIRRPSGDTERYRYGRVCDKSE